MPKALILDAKSLAPAKPIPLGLEGRRLEREGRPINFRRKEIARVGNWTHRGTGEPLPLPRARLEAWSRNTNALIAAGARPYLPNRHRTDIKPDDPAHIEAGDNYGHVLGTLVEGDSLYADLELVGEKALDAIAANDCSVYIVDEMLDASGTKYGESLQHLAIVPNPALPNLKPFERIAASADAPARDVPVYQLAASAPIPQRSHTMTPENARKLREKFGIGADVPDEQLPDRAAEKALALSADVETANGKITALTTERDTAKQERDAEKSRVLALSADGPAPIDPMAMSLITRAFKTDREQVIASGVISEAGMKEVDALFFSDGKPTNAALALSAGSTDPRYSRLCEILRKNPGIKHNNQVPRGATAATANRDPIAASADANPTFDEDYNAAKAARDAQHEARGVKA